MTRSVHSRVKCKDCGVEVVCPKCRQPATSFTPFSDWLRALPFPYNSKMYDNQNLDYIWFHYRQGWLITIEEKRFGGTPTEAQADTHGIVAQMLAGSSPCQVTTMRGRRHIEYRGHYLVVFEQTTPDDSAWLLINGAAATKDCLMTLLQTGRLEPKEARQ